MNTKAAHYKELGNECMKCQDFHAAVDHYTKGLAVEPKNPILNCNVSQAYLNLQNFYEAEKFAEIAIEAKNNYTKAYFRAAKAALGRHDVFRSMNFLLRGVQNCSGENLEDLFAMARDLSEVFEKELRAFHSSVEDKEGSFIKEMKSAKAGSKDNLKQACKPPPGKNETEGKMKKDQGEDKGKQVAEPKKDSEFDSRKKSKKEQEKEQVMKESESKDIERRENECQERDGKAKDNGFEKRKGKKGAEKDAAKLELQNQMKEGSMAFQKGLYHKAVDCFRRIMTKVNHHKSQAIQNLGLDAMEMVVVSFTLSQALILSDEYKDVVEGITILNLLEKEGKHHKFPAILLLLGRAYLRLNRFKDAQVPLGKGLSFLTRGAAFSRYSWPGTYDVIDLTDKEILKKALEDDMKESKVYHKPDFICCYKGCHSTNLNHHIIPLPFIYFSDLDFVGYVSLECQEHCFTYFHLTCWKEYKESLSEVQKLSEKDILGRDCITPDCVSKFGKHSVIIKVRIIGADGEEKSSCKFTPAVSPPVPKDSEASARNPKKKLSRKKNGDKGIRRAEKKVIPNSKNKSAPGTSRSYAEVVDVSHEDHLQNAVDKLTRVRDKRFGYQDDLIDPRRNGPVSKPVERSKEQEFICTFFQEIFKKEGLMSVDKLKEHWETNKEILPALQPALVTFTDLARFLLDTGMFAMIQDTIGLACDLSDMYEVVQAQFDSQKLHKTLQLSPATTEEVKRTLTLSSSSQQGTVEVRQSSSNTSQSSEFCALLGKSKQGIQVLSNAGGYSVSKSGEIEVEECVGEIAKSNIIPGSSAVKESIKENGILQQGAHAFCNGCVEPLCVASVKCAELTPHATTHQKLVWKPRAKLLEWATTTFPLETQAKLWKALTVVRSENNDTLSQLSYDSIRDRVSKVLLKMDGAVGRNVY